MLTRKTIARCVLGRPAWKEHAMLHAAILLSLAMGTATLAADGSAGVVRVSDQAPQSSSNAAVPPAPAPAVNPATAAANGPVAAGPGCNTCNSGTCGNGNCGRCRNGLLGSCCLCSHCNCGWRFLDAHCYCMTYPVNPWYCDGRDGRVYAAYGYGVPMTVPLAPTVTNQYNLGWGIPSGRLTPISRVAPYPGTIAAAAAPY
jgi:hypothetical protein